MSLTTSLSKALNDSVLKILDANLDGLYDITMTFFSSENREFVYKVDYFQSIGINQNFMRHYTDVITLEIRFRPEEYLRILQNAKGLRCRIEFRSVNRSTQKVGKPVFELNQMVIIKEKSDVLKRVAKGDLVPTVDAPQLEAHLSNYITVEVDLIDDIVYSMRKQKTNFIARKTTVEDVLILIAELFGISSVYIVPPSNTKVYENFVIPPMLSLGDILTYIQNHDAMGIYDYDVGYYITSGVLYIYPLLDTDPKSKSTVHIYNVGAGTYSGCDSYHRFDKSDIHLISNVGAEDLELIYEGLENTGNSFIIQPPEKLLDNWRTMGSRSFTINKDNLVTINLEVPDGITSDVYSPVFKRSDNMHKLRTELAANYITLVNIGWDHAVPMLIKPGGRIEYHYDGDGKYITRSGLCNGVVYEFKPIASLGKKLYACSAALSLSIGNQ